MSFPADIKGCMKDCILSLFWPRKDIVGFFEKHGCTKAEVGRLQIEGENGLKRHEIVDALFETLAARADNGLGPFRAMLQSLLNWSHFDPYYFDKLRKLDRSTANKNLEHLRQLQEIRDAKIKADRERRAAQEAVRQQPTASLEQLRVEYLDLLANKTSRQQRGFRRALENEVLKGKFIVAVGKTEWENLKWDDHSIAEKKTLINGADLVFTASESPEDYAKARAKLKESGVNFKLLDCSDAHWLSASGDKDRIGNCFSWIKADCTFKGLLQSIEEFDDRVYVGDNPPKRHQVDLNRTKFIRSIKVAKKEGAKLADTWFNMELPLNPDLVAIIGNKGSGKSALADIIALAGNTKNHRGFSFLNEARFRDPRAKLAQHFVGTLTWRDGSETPRDLDKDPEPSSVERVKYLPQSYLETLCNELGAGGSVMRWNAFSASLPVSHVWKPRRRSA